MRQTTLLLILLCGLVTIAEVAQSQTRQPRVNIAIATDGPWERNDEILALFRREMSELLSDEFDVRFPARMQMTGDWTNPTMTRLLDEVLADPEVDIVIALGLLATNNVCRRASLPKPVIAPIAIDINVQGLPFRDGASGRPNLNYLTLPDNFARDINIFREISPFSSVVTLSSANIADAIPNLNQRTRETGADLDVSIDVVRVGASAQAALDQIPPDAEAVYLYPMLHLAPAERAKLIAGLNERRIPTFAYMGQSDVAAGAMAGMGDDKFFVRLSRRVAINAQRILLGEDAGDIPVNFSSNERLYLNMGTVKAVGVYPAWGIMTEAQILGDNRDERKRRLSLRSAMDEAMNANLDIKAQERSVAAGREDIRRARAGLLPQISLSATGLVIDKDRAEASFGGQAEQTVSGTLQIDQLVYAEPAWANLNVQEHLQEARQSEYEQLRLDIAAEAATAYLNLLRAKTFERIQKENLLRTRANLELAQVRREVGTAGPAEVYRWESEIAQNRKAVIDANAQRNVVEIQVNQLLRRPAEESFATEEAELRDADLITNDGRYVRYFSNKWTFGAFRSFMVEEALRNAPELAQIDAAMRAQRRLQSSASSALYLPSVGLQGNLTNRFLREGAGSEGTDFSGLPAELQFLSSAFPAQPDDLDWSIGLNLSLPLFEGGARYAAIAQAEEEMQRLRLQRQALADRIEQRVRAELHLAGASFAGIEQTKAGADAARRNLELVVDAYSRGALSIIDLVDAQNAALVADEAAANAVFDFLLDAIGVQRAVGSFGALTDDAERERLLQRLEAYFANVGAPLPE